MRRLWVRWLGLLAFVVVLATAFVNLGQWQLHRLEQRRERNETVVQHEAAPVVPLATRGYDKVQEADQWQRVELRGTFDADHQLQVRYRSNSGETGTEVVTPLRTTDGRVVLVDRGFIRTPKGEPPPATLPAPPTGTVTVVGHLRRSENGPTAAITPGQGAVRLVNAPAIGRWLGAEVMDGYVGLLTVTPEQTGDFDPVAVPTLDEGPHFWYAVQWFMFCGFALVGLLWFVRNDIVERRKARAAATPTDTPTQED